MVIAGVSFVGACALISSLLPLPEIEPFSSKLRFYRAHRAEIDTLFVGSSRIYQQISPVLFDEETLAGRTPTHAFNLGMNGMLLSEEDYLLEQILPESRGKLRWVFIELESLPLGFDPNNMASKRIGYWHDWTRTQTIFRKIFRWDEKGKRKATPDIILGSAKQKRRHRLFILHLSLFARQSVNLGRFQDVADWWTHRGTAPDATLLGPARDGYHPVESHLAANRRADYEQALRAAMTTAEPKVLDSYTEETCRHSAEIVRRSGAIPVFIVPPVLNQSPLVFRGSVPAPGATLCFNNALRYPGLYRVAVRADPLHLNRTGSTEFSQAIGRDFVAALRAGVIR